MNIPYIHLLQLVQCMSYKNAGRGNKTFLQINMYAFKNLHLSAFSGFHFVRLLLSKYFFIFIIYFLSYVFAVSSSFSSSFILHFSIYFLSFGFVVYMRQKSSVSILNVYLLHYSFHFESLLMHLLNTYLYIRSTNDRWRDVPFVYSFCSSAETSTGQWNIKHSATMRLAIGMLEGWMEWKDLTQHRWREGKISVWWINRARKEGIHSLNYFSFAFVPMRSHQKAHCGMLLFANALSKEKKVYRII